MNELALFAGAGGGILGGQLLGWHTVAACELEPYPRECLLARQRDGQLDRFPIWDDVCTFDGRPWRGLVDVVSGGFPCQDISSAGKGAGIEGARSGLWKEMFRIICEVRPRYAFMENSPMLTSRGLGVVLGDLAEAGYNAEWLVLGAADLGAPHQRDRIWILAEDTQRGELLSHADVRWIGWRQQQQEGFAQTSGEKCVAEHSNLHDERAESAVSGCEQAPDAEGVCEEVGEHPAPLNTHAHGVQCTEQGGEHEGTQKLAGGCTNGVESRRAVGGADVPDPAFTQREGADALPLEQEQEDTGAGYAGSVWGSGRAWEVEPCVGRVADGVARRVDRLRAIGNGQVPAVAAAAFLELKRRLEA